MASEKSSAVFAGEREQYPIVLEQHLVPIVKDQGLKPAQTVMGQEKHHNNSFGG